MPPPFLILLFGDVGDTLLTVPALRAIRRRHPDRRLVLLAKHTPAEIIQALGLADNVILVDKHVFDRPAALLQPPALLSLLRVLRRVRRERADTVILFHHLLSRWGTIKFALLTLASGAGRRIGVANGRGWFLTERVPDRGLGAVHEAEYWMQVAGLLGAHGDLTLEVPVREEDRATADALIGEIAASDQPIVAIHPGTGWFGPGRRWPAERFAAAARLVARQRSVSWVIVGTEQEGTEAAQVEALLGSSAYNFAGRTTLGELAAILERCDALVANDGGVAHVAAAVGTPVVAIFGPSNERAWRPLTGRVVAADLPCRPCFYRDRQTGNRMGCATRECLALVTPALVADEIAAAIESPLFAAKQT